jgi:cytochrome c biogenesis protein CcdA
VSPLRSSFNGQYWLFGWAPAALTVFGVWLVLNWSRSKASQSPSTAAWYLLYSIATLPVILFASALRALLSHDYFAQWWANGHWLAWGLYLAAWIWIGVVIWRVVLFSLAMQSR